jgi:hypothetical protein
MPTDLFISEAIIMNPTNTTTPPSILLKKAIIIMVIMTMNLKEKNTWTEEKKRVKYIQDNFIKRPMTIMAETTIPILMIIMGLYGWMEMEQ